MFVCFERWFFAIYESPAYGIEKILSFTIGRGGRGWSTVSLFQQVTPQVIYLWIMVLLKQRRRSRPLILVIRDPIWPRLIKSHLRRVSAVNSEVTEPMTTHNRSRVGTLPRHATILSAPLFRFGTRIVWNLNRALKIKRISDLLPNRCIVCLYTVKLNASLHLLKSILRQSSSNFTPMVY